NPDKYRFSNEFDFITVDTSSSEAIFRAAIDVLEGSEISAVMSTSEYFVKEASILASRLNLPALNDERISICRNKYRLRRALQNRGMGEVRSYRIAAASDREAAAVETGFPAVLKPISGSGSSGVRLCSNLNELEATYKEARSVSQSSRFDFDDGAYVLESYVGGEEFSVEIFNGEMMGITRKHLGEMPYFVETGHDFNCDINEDLRKAIDGEVNKLISLLKINWGPLHVELKVHEGKVFVIEVNPRLAGGMIPFLVHATTGIDLISAWLAAALGETPVLEKTKDRAGHIRFLIPSDNSNIKQSADGAYIEGIVSSSPEEISIESISLYRGIGEEIFICNDFRDRIGHVILTANKPVGNIASKIAQSILERVIND